MKHIATIQLFLVFFFVSCSSGRKPLETLETGTGLDSIADNTDFTFPPPIEDEPEEDTTTIVPMASPLPSLTGTPAYYPPMVDVVVVDNAFTSAPTHCDITFPVCRAFPELAAPGYIRRDYFRDNATGKFSSTDRQTCFNRALHFVGWCQNLPGEPVTANYFDGYGVQPSTRTNSGCVILPEKCPYYPANSGIAFKDGDPTASDTAAKCAQRAKDYAGWCRTPVGASVLSTFFDTYGKATPTLYRE